MTEYLQVVTTIDSEQQARDLARQVLEARLAACVQVHPCFSLYHWQGRLAEEAEFRCLFKTRKDLLPALLELLDEIHPYEVPEILALPVFEGSAPYLAWLNQELRPMAREEE